jgi:hypothetical protein
VVQLVKVNSMSKLKQILKDDIRDSMSGVSNVVRTTMILEAEDKVYKAYNRDGMKYVRRRYGSGGLLSEGSFKHDYSVNGNTFRSVTQNIAKANVGYDPIVGSSSQYITPLLVYGHGGKGGSYSHGNKYPYSYVKPRDFITPAREKLKSGKGHVTGLWMALEDKGHETSTW